MILRSAILTRSQLGHRLENEQHQVRLGSLSCLIISRATRFNEAIVYSLEEIRERCKTVSEKSNDEDVLHQVQRYMVQIQIMEKISSWSDSAQAEDTQGLSRDAEAKLQTLLDESFKQQVDMITGRLEVLKWILDDAADIPVLLGGSDARIEQVSCHPLYPLKQRRFDMI